jgi:hypothetical protein
MQATTFRILAACALFSTAGSAMAETYTAKIYGVPSGFLQMFVFGAGDNGLMSGYVTNGSIREAGYLTNSGFKNMHPAGWYSSEIADSWASTYHCGSGRTASGSPQRALFWLGGGAAVDIHPAGAEYLASEAYGGGGQQQVGWVVGSIACDQCGFTTVGHAGTWSRTAMSFARLHSTTHENTVARGTDGTTQVGYGTNRTDNSKNALLWKGPGTFSTNIRPSGSIESVANSVWGNQQGGYFVGMGTNSKRHAVIWSGTAASAVDIHPSVFEHSHVNAVRNGLQVGYGNPLSTPTRNQAIAWHGNAGTWINLHSKLPYPYNLWSSSATGIDNLGNVTGYITAPSGPEIRPVIWLRS